MQSDIDQENSLSLNEPITESAVSIRGNLSVVQGFFFNLYFSVP